jgi:hypothetical protein
MTEAPTLLRGQSHFFDVSFIQLTLGKFSPCVSRKAIRVGAVGDSRILLTGTARLRKLGCGEFMAYPPKLYLFSMTKRLKERGRG